MASAPNTMDFIERVYGISPQEWRTLPRERRSEIEREVLPVMSTGSNVDIRDWGAIMASSNPLEAARAAQRQMYESNINTNVNQPGSWQLDQFPNQVAPGTGAATVMPDESGRFLDYRDASGNLVGRAQLGELTGPNRSSQLANIQALLNAGVRLSEIQAAVPDVDFSQFGLSDTPSYTENLLRSDAAQLAARRRAEELQRQPLENFGYAQKTAETLQRQIGSIRNNIARGYTGGDTYQQDLLDRYAREAADLARYGWNVNPATGQLISRPDVPLVQGIGSYPLNLQQMMSPERYAQYVDMYFTGPTDQGVGRGDLQSDIIQALITQRASDDLGTNALDTARSSQDRIFEQYLASIDPSLDTAAQAGVSSSVLPSEMLLAASNVPTFVQPTFRGII